MTRQILKFLTALLVLVALFFFFNFNRNSPPDTQSIKKNENTLSIGEVNVKIEIADNVFEQSQGLSGRESLASDAGMLFVFPEPTITGFWMKDMKFSLDFIWIDESGKIIAIDKNVSPATYPNNYLPPSPVKYVLEVNSGWTDENNIKVGDIVLF